MKDLWISTIQRTLLRLMMYIKMKVDDQATFTNFLDTFQNLSSVELAELYKDLMMGTILHSDIKALIVRIQSNKPFNLTNLGAKFLFYFFQSFKAILWKEHCDKMAIWEIQHHITP